ncbi:MAG: toll/interleukin-1 receptor domain-containing protein [Candidatus Babeliaceae bacterium]|nr:toll/interleukin-1 receptor domain-containing protein [Candidatus Babeliaceae bacterium]
MPGISNLSHRRLVDRIKTKHPVGLLVNEDQVFDIAHLFSDDQRAHYGIGIEHGFVFACLDQNSFAQSPIYESIFWGCIVHKWQNDLRKINNESAKYCVSELDELHRSYLQDGTSIAPLSSHFFSKLIECVRHRYSLILLLEHFDEFHLRIIPDIKRRFHALVDKGFVIVTIEKQPPGLCSGIEYIKVDEEIEPPDPELLPDPGYPDPEPPQRPGDENQMNKNRISFFYSIKDREWLNRIREMLSPLIDNGTIQPWDDGDIGPGEEWGDVIANRIELTDIAILLASPSALDSKYIKEHELPKILEARQARKLRFTWILVSDCMYGETPLGQIQSLWDKNDGPQKPLDSIRNRNSILKKMAQKIKQMI